MNKKKLKIAIFHLAFIYSGGGEKLVLQEARGLEKLGHDVHIFAPVVDKKRCFPDIIKDFEIKTFLPQPDFTKGHESFLIVLSCILAPFFAFRFRNYDVILAANQPSPWIAWWVKRLFGVPYVSYLAQPTRFLYPRDIDRETGLAFNKRASESLTASLMRHAKGFIRWADTKSIKESTLVFANGRYIKKLLDKTYKIKTISCPAGAHVSNNIIDIGKRESGTVRVNGEKIDKPYLLISNRHFPQKRFEYGIFAFSAITSEHPEFKLVITGQETDYTEEIKVISRRLGLESKVILLGYINEKNLRKLYENAFVYLYTAPEEDFGMGIVEAMAQATPVVAWNNAGPRGIIKDGTSGLLAKPFVVSDFSNKVFRLTKDKRFAKKVGEKGLLDVKKRFSYQHHLIILERYLLDVYFSDK